MKQHTKSELLELVETLYDAGCACELERERDTDTNALIVTIRFEISEQTLRMVY